MSAFEKIWEKANIIKATKTSQILRTLETNLQDLKRLTSSTRIEVLIMFTFRQIEEEVNIMKITETSLILELLESLEVISFSAQVISNFFTMILN